MTYMLSNSTQHNASICEAQVIPFHRCIMVLLMPSVTCSCRQNKATSNPCESKSNFKAASAC